VFETEVDGLMSFAAEGRGCHTGFYRAQDTDFIIDFLPHTKSPV
jgi:hypothetical protein